MKSDNKSKDYERLTQAIYADVLNLEGFDNINVQHNVHITGKSGVKHQVDVFWEFQQAGVLHKT
jgi:hypothetical protein